MGIKSDPVHNIIKEYENSSRRKRIEKFSEYSFVTYLCKVNNVKLVFTEKRSFYDITHNRLIKIIDEWIATKSNHLFLSYS